MDALDLLTYDCWMEVLLRVKAAKDLKSCSEACLTFQDILKKKRNQFLFNLILPHVLEYLSEDYVDDQGADRKEWNALLKCRLVCKSWRKSVDEQVCSEDLLEDAYIFESGALTESFLQKFATHNGNPIIGRQVILPLLSPLLLAENLAEGPNPNAPEEEEVFHVSKLRQLLERFGREMWKVELFDFINNEHLAFCKNLQTILGHLPNMRSLALYCPPNGDEVMDPIYHYKELNQDEQAELTNYMAANPVPTLPQLECLKAVALNGMMIRSLLEECAPTLKILHVGDPRGFPEQGSRFSNLWKLEFYCVDASTSLHCLGQLRSPLRILSLSVIQNSNNVEVWAVDTLFRYMRHLPIRELDITIENVFLGESGPIPAIQRPVHLWISSVTLSCPGGSASLNFLLYCLKLKNLVIYRGPSRQGLPDGHPHGVAESLDVNGLLEQVGYDMYDSDIWKNLHALRSFELHNYVSGEGDLQEWKSDEYVRGEYAKRKLGNGLVR